MNRLTVQVSIVHSGLLVRYFSLENTTAEDCLMTIRAHAKRTMVKARLASGQRKPVTRSIPTSRRIRIGYLCHYFTKHPVGQVLSKAFTYHDKAQFEIFCYSTAKSDDSPYRKLIEETCEHFEDVKEFQDEQIDQLIRDHSIDILVDVNGLWDHHRLGAMYSRPAPIQVHWLAFPNPLTLPFIDYYIGDSIVIPPEGRKHFTESVVYLPNSYLITSHKELGYDPIESGTKTRSQAGLPKDKVGILQTFSNNSLVYICNLQFHGKDHTTSI
jgi:predicted O-linked N-acetylglucosamine transferase (SPINDLY family)